MLHVTLQTESRKDLDMLIKIKLSSGNSKTDLSMLIKIKLPSRNSLGAFYGPFPIERGKAVVQGLNRAGFEHGLCSHKLVLYDSNK
jgi:hypothetical protein